MGCPKKKVEEAGIEPNAALGRIVSRANHRDESDGSLTGGIPTTAPTGTNLRRRSRAAPRTTRMLGTRTSGLKLKSRERERKFKVKDGGRISEAKFSEGTVVEVKSNEEGYQGSWFTAVIVGSIPKDKFLVQYQTLKTDDETELLKERVDASCIRPCPSVIQRVDRFKLFEKVDAWYNDGWWVGLISRVLGGLNYTVYFWTTNEELEFGHFSLRPHQEWIGGKWIIDFLPRPGKLKRRNGLITLEANYFSKGMKVEVKSDEEGYSGSWYPAVIIGSKWTGKPCPPVIQRRDPFEPFDEVDAWYNAAWWAGGICKVLQGSKFAVYIKGTNEVLEFQHSDLRPHQDWIDGKWVIPCREAFGEVMNSAFGRPLKPPFNPYANELNFLLASYVVPYVGLTGYVGANPKLQSPTARRDKMRSFEGYFTSEHKKVKPYGITVAEFTNRVSELRNRTPEEILRIVYGGGDEHVPGGFYPKGADGRMLNHIYDWHDASSEHHVAS
ncbi:hypothetical protein Acr_29g0009220 [Actinidia rufa]|uniref:Agenet domain-containing protein n=1 Tax=Actinidia rufa TaxID=165716 RepID=A0A7J0HF50_9ERIC|nr:hypothetical protein Acr_29g0009220 [Actinidia rufa]